MKEKIHPDYFVTQVTCGCGNYVRHAQHAQGAEGRHLQRLPPVLHGQAEVRGHGRPHRAVQEQVRQASGIASLKRGKKGAAVEAAEPAPSRPRKRRVGPIGSTGPSAYEDVIRRARSRAAHGNLPTSLAGDKFVHVEKHAGDVAPDGRFVVRGIGSAALLLNEIGEPRDLPAATATATDTTGTPFRSGRDHRPRFLATSAVARPRAISITPRSLAIVSACSGVLLGRRRVQVAFPPGASNVVSIGWGLERKKNVYNPRR